MKDDMKHKIDELFAQYVVDAAKRGADAEEVAAQMERDVTALQATLEPFFAATTALEAIERRAMAGEAISASTMRATLDELDARLAGFARPWRAASPPLRAWVASLIRQPEAVLDAFIDSMAKRSAAHRSTVNVTEAQTKQAVRELLAGPRAKA